jgi:hypothetical protein
MDRDHFDYVYLYLHSVKYLATASMKEERVFEFRLAQHICICSVLYKSAVGSMAGFFLRYDIG